MLFSERRCASHSGAAPGILISIRIGRRQQRRAVIAGAQIKIIGAGAQRGVEGDAQLAAVRRGIGLAVVGDEHLRLRPVHLHEIVDLAADLAAVACSDAPQITRRVLHLHGDAALVDHAVELLLQLHEHAVARAGGAVAAQPQLFLIYRLFQRRADKIVIIGIVVNVADGIAADICPASCKEPCPEALPGTAPASADIFFRIA